jgi:hypothetical protein
MTIHLHIDQLVLDGLPVETCDAAVVQAAVEMELTRLFTNGAIAPGLRTGGARASVPSQGIRLTGNETPAIVGQQIGRAVYGGISK